MSALIPMIVEIFKCTISRSGMDESLHWLVERSKEMKSQQQRSE